MIERIAKIIEEELCSVYCPTCAHYNDFDSEGCEFCHRKYMNWQISNDAATEIAKKIMEIVHE